MKMEHVSILHVLDVQMKTQTTMIQRRPLITAVANSLGVRIWKHAIMMQQQMPLMALAHMPERTSTVMATVLSIQTVTVCAMNLK